MYYFSAAVALALAVFFLGLPVTIRRIRAQREALHPLRPIVRRDHLSCIVNTVGAVLTELLKLGLAMLVALLLGSAVLGMIGAAPDIGSGLRHVSLAGLMLILAIVAIGTVLLIGGAFILHALLAGAAIVVLVSLIVSDVNSGWPALLLFVLLAYAAPALLIALIRRLF